MWVSLLKRSSMLLSLLSARFAFDPGAGCVVLGVMTALLRVLAVLGVPAVLTDDGVFLYTLRMDVLPQNSFELPVHSMLHLLASAVTAVVGSEELQ